MCLSSFTMKSLLSIFTLFFFIEVLQAVHENGIVRTDTTQPDANNVELMVTNLQDVSNDKATSPPVINEGEMRKNIDEKQNCGKRRKVSRKQCDQPMKTKSYNNKMAVATRINAGQGNRERTKMIEENKTEKELSNIKIISSEKQAEGAPKRRLNSTNSASKQYEDAMDNAYEIRRKADIEYKNALQKAEENKVAAERKADPIRDTAEKKEALALASREFKEMLGTANANWNQAKYEFYNSIKRAQNEYRIADLNERVASPSYLHRW